MWSNISDDRQGGLNLGHFSFILLLLLLCFWFGGLVHVA